MIRLVWLALGMFAVGTESFMIAGLLPSIAEDLNVSITAAGQLVTAFALVYAIGSPILATLTAGVERKRLLTVSMALFLLANLVAATASSYLVLMLARILLAVSAGVFAPAAYGFAGVLAVPQRRARALSIVLGGASTAVALGVPLGTWIGGHLDWRATFLGVALLSALAWIGIVWRLPRQAPQAAATLAQRVRIAVSPGVGRALLVTLLWATGWFTVYTYIAVILSTVASAGTDGLSLVLFAFGVGAVAGTFSSGAFSDRFGADRVVTWALITSTVAIGCISLIGDLSSGTVAFVSIVGFVGTIGVVNWGFFVAQQSRIVSLAHSSAPIALSLNQSAFYLGIALGAAIGSGVLQVASPAYLGWVGAVLAAAAASTLLLGFRKRARQLATTLPARATT